MKNILRCRTRKGKLKIIDLNGDVIDSVNPISLEDTLEILTLKYGTKKRK